MAALTNNFEGGTNGTAITTANSGGTSGDAFAVVGTNSGISPTFDNTHAAHGSLGMKLAQHDTTVGWSITNNHHYGRFYLYITGAPSQPIYLYVSAANTACLVLNTSGGLDMYRNGSVFASFTNAPNVNAWCRIEFNITMANGALFEAKLFNTPDSTTATETQSFTSNFTNNANVTFGFTPVNTAPSFTFWMDDLVDDATSYPGPAVLPPVTKTQTAIARIQITGTDTQNAVARIQNTVTKNQSAIARIQNTVINTQGALARIQKSLSATITAIARIQGNSIKDQPAVARIQTTPTKTQAAISRISAQRTATQTATAHIFTTGTIKSKDQLATARIINTQTKTQSATARIGLNAAEAVTNMFDTPKPTMNNFELATSTNAFDKSNPDSNFQIDPQIAGFDTPNPS